LGFSETSIEQNQVHVLAVESEYIRQPLLVHCFASTMCPAQDNSLLLSSVATEVNNVWPVHHEQPLKIPDPCGCPIVELETIAIWTFANFLEDLSFFFIHQDSARRPWI
jgi:hypothetical protein